MESVFGKYSSETQKLADQASANVGLAKTDYSNLASVIGAQLKNMGVDQSKLVGQTDDLITMGADLAATFGGTTADAVAALSSLMRGERDPIEKYGVSIKAADVQAQKAAMGLDKLTGNAAKSADTQATLALLAKQTASAHGQFAREADSAAGSQQIAEASFKDAAATLGQVLLPIMSQAAVVLGDLAKWVSENSQLVTILALIVGGLAAAILLVNGALMVYRAAMVVATAAQWAYNAAASANPIGLIILLIAALVAAIVWLIANWKAVSRVAGDVINAIVNWVRGLIKTMNLDEIIGRMIAAFLRVRARVGEVFDAVIGRIRDAIGWIQDAIGLLGKFFGMGGDSHGGGSGGADAPDPHVGDDDPGWGTGGWPTWAAGTGTSSPAPAAPSVINITVQGAIDPLSTARQIKALLADLGHRTGTLATAGGPR